MHKLIQGIAIAYFGIGGLVAALSVGSAAVFYSFGPGAIWSIGFLSWITGAILSFLFAMLRFITWPFGVYSTFATDQSFWAWLFYLWQ